MAIIHCWSSGSNTSPYETWAKAATSLSTAISAWSSGDDIRVRQDNNVLTSSSSDLTFADPSASGEPIVITSANASDEYAISTTTGQITTTSGNYAIDFGSNGSNDYVLRGMYLDSNEDIYVDPQDGTMYFEDCKFEFTTSQAEMWCGGTDSAGLEFKNCTFIVGSSSRFICYGNRVRFVDCSFDSQSNTVDAQGFFWPNQHNESQVIELIGCDFSNVVFGQGLFDAQNVNSEAEGAGYTMRAINCLMPATWQLIDSNATPYRYYQIAEAVGCSDDNSTYSYELSSGAGTISTDTSNYVTSGYTSDYGSQKLSYKMTARTSNWKGNPLRGPWINGWNDTTGSRTFTLKVANDLSSTPTNMQLYLEVEYFGTSTESKVDYADSRPTDFLAEAAIADSNDDADWTKPDISPIITHDLAVTITAQKEGFYRARVVMEDCHDLTGDLYYEPLVTIS